MVKDYYKVLDLPAEFKAHEIEERFLKTIPGIRDHSRLVDWKEAYCILGDVKRREVYDSLYEAYYMKRPMPADHDKMLKQIQQWGAEARNKAVQEPLVVENSSGVADSLTVVGAILEIASGIIDVVSES